MTSLKTYTQQSSILFHFKWFPHYCCISNLKILINLGNGKHSGFRKDYFPNRREKTFQKQPCYVSHKGERCWKCSEFFHELRTMGRMVNYDISWKVKQTVGIVFFLIHFGMSILAYPVHRFKTAWYGMPYYCSIFLVASDISKGKVKLKSKKELIKIAEIAVIFNNLSGFRKGVQRMYLFTSYTNETRS